MTFDVEFQLDDKSFTLNDTSAAAAEAAADRAESAAETLSGSVEQIAENKNDISSLKEDLSESVGDLKSDLDEYADIFTGNVDESVKNWLDEHPEATTTVEDGSITDVKLSSKLTKEIENKQSLYMIDYKTLPNDGYQGSYYSSDWKALQSVAYNKNNNEYVLLYSDGDNTGDCLIVKIDSNFDFISRVAIPSSILGHCNDITFDPINNRYCVATQNSGEIAILNASTLTHETSIIIDGVGATAQIAYDEENEMYYLTDTSANLFRVAKDFSVATKVTTFSADDFPIPYSGISTKYLQGSCVYDGRFISAWWMGGSELSYYRLIIFSEDGTEAINCYDFIASSLYDESEGLTISSDGDLLCFGYQNENVFVYRLSNKAQYVDYPYPISVKRYNYTSNSQTLLEDISKNPAPSFYRAFIHFSVAHPNLGGADGLLEGFTSVEKNGWQRFVSPIITAIRTLVNGTWNAWTVYKLGYSVTSILADVGNSYSQINTSDSRIIYVVKDGISMLDFKFKCSSAISSGTVNLPSSIGASLTEVHSALTSIDGKSGFVQYNGRLLVIRCASSPTNYLCGQLVFPSNL